MRVRMILALVAGLALMGDAPPPQMRANCKDPQSNLEMKICAAQDLKAAEAELAMVFDKAIKDAQAQYDSSRGMQGTVPMPNMPEELRRVEKTWEAFRDANCEYQRLVYWGGTMAPLAVTGCRLDMTRARIKELKELIDPK